MSLFIPNPLDLSSQTLELLDRALSEVWRELELQNKLPPAKASEISIPRGPLARVTALAHMIAFDFDAPAELFSSAGQGVARGTMQYRRFASGAQAIRYAIEDLPAALLRGSIIQVDDDRFDARQIRELYDCPAYPLARAAYLAETTGAPCAKSTTCCASPSSSAARSMSGRQ
jgi:hypothetical protein